MRTRIAALPILPLVASVALAASPAPATSAGEMCLGQTATIVGGPSQATLTGTAGDDVIVTAGSARVNALGGSDTVCVTSPGVRVTVSAGAGDDDVVASSARSVVAYLGSGADTYEGGPHKDRVYGGDGDNPDVGQPDNMPDRITTGDGDDGVYLYEPADAYGDVVALGAGSDSLELEIPVGAAAVDSLADLGAGTDSILLRQSRGGTKTSWTVDAGAGTVTSGGIPANRLPFRSAEAYEFLGLYATTLDFRGTDADELIFGAPFGVVDMRGGDDTLLATFGFPTGPLVGGGGDDSLSVVARKLKPRMSSKRLKVDLRRGQMTSGGGAPVEISGFENVQGGGENVILVGDSGPNRLLANACTARVIGGKGRDFFGFFPQDDLDQPCGVNANKRYVFFGGPGADRSAGTRGVDTLYGGPGNDKLAGSSGGDRIFGGSGKRDKLKGQRGNDRLFGGGGRADVAFGGKGWDLCRAERQASCER